MNEIPSAPNWGSFIYFILCVLPKVRKAVSAANNMRARSVLNKELKVLFCSVIANSELYLSYEFAFIAYLKTFRTRY